MAQVSTRVSLEEKFDALKVDPNKMNTRDLKTKSTTGLNNPPEKKKSAGRSVDAMFYIVVTLITPQSFKIRPLEGFEKIAFFHFFTYDG